jgi:hypothetical protein
MDLWLLLKEARLLQEAGLLDCAKPFVEPLSSDTSSESSSRD